MCDGCGFLYNLRDLREQWDWCGTSMVNKHVLKCGTCFDLPQEQRRMIILPPDPPPVRNPRPEAEHVDVPSELLLAATLDATSSISCDLLLIPIAGFARRQAGRFRVLTGPRVVPNPLKGAAWRRQVAVVIDP